MRQRILAAVLAAAALAASGCVGYEVKPPKPAEYPKADAPAALKVGVLLKNQPFVFDAMGMSASRMDSYRSWSRFHEMFAQIDGIGAKFIDALNGSRAFARVDEVKSMGFFGSDRGGHNLFMDAEFTGRFSQDPAMFPKAFLTGFFFFLPAPFIRYEDTYRASADVSVYDGAGRLVHKYTEQQDVGTTSALFSAGMPNTIAAGIESASSNLAAKLVTAIIADREGFVKASRSAGSVAHRKRAAEADEDKDDDDSDEASDAKGGAAMASDSAAPAAASDSSGSASSDDDPPAPKAAPEPAAKLPEISPDAVAAELMP
jgi:hypothetical protein